MRYFCGRCESEYSSKENWVKHYDRKQQRRELCKGGGMVHNICYQQDKSLPKIFHTNLETGKSLYKTALRNQALFQKKIEPNKDVIEDNVSQVQDDSIDLVVEEMNNDTVIIPKGVKRLRLDSDSENTQKESEPITTDIGKEILKKLTELSVSQEKNHDVQMSSINKIKQTTITQHPYARNIDLDTNIRVDNLMSTSLLKLKHAASMEEILQNSLITTDFKITENEHDTSNRHLQCICCSDYAKRNNSVKCTIFNVQDFKYKQLSDLGKPMPIWFKNFKRSILRHLSNINHHQNSASYKIISSKLLSSKSDIYKLCSSLIYYTFKSNTAFSLYPVLLAVLSRCDNEVGNINHTRRTCTMMLDLVDNELKEKTRAWVDSEKSVTITADIGTMQGLVLLVVLLISDTTGNTKLAGFKLVSSKSGYILANEIVDILCGSDGMNIQQPVLRNKISGFSGDGAFIKGNEPFKTQLKKLINDNLKFRWDLLHLINRAHIYARDISITNNPNDLSVSSLMNYIQSTCKV